MSKRRNHDAGFKVSMALEAVKGERSVSELAAESGVHPTMIHQWKKALRGHRTSSNTAGRRRQRSTRRRCGRCTRRSESWPSPTIFCHESSSPGPASEARDDQMLSPYAVGRGASLRCPWSGMRTFKAAAPKGSLGPAAATHQSISTQS